MLKKTDIKQIALILVSAIVFMSVFLFLHHTLYYSQETAIFKNTFSLKNNLPDYLNSEKEFSKISSKIKFDTIPFQKIKSVKILPTIKTENADIEILLVISIEYEGKSVLWKSFKLQKQLQALNKWQVLEQVYNFNDFNFNKNYTFKAYIWNKSKSEFTLKNISVEFYDKKIESKNLVFQ